MTVAIETGRLRLRTWEDADKPVFHAALSADARVMEHLGGVMSRAASDAVVDRLAAATAAQGHGFWAIERRADRLLLGFCGPRRGGPHSSVEHEVELGWRLRADAWGQGYAIEAAMATVAWVWDMLSDPRVVAYTIAANRRSARVMERLGMTRRPELDFAHPAFAADHPLSAHVTYALDRPR